MRTIESEEVTRRGIAVHAGRFRFADGAAPEERLKVVVDACEPMFEEEDLRQWLKDQLDNLMEQWAAGAISRSNAVSLHTTLVGSASLGELAGITGPELKKRLEGRLGDADDFDLLDDLWRVDPDLFDMDERLEMVNEFRSYAESALYEDTGMEELDAIERVADSFGVSLDDENMEEARSRAGREEWEPDIEDYRESREEFEDSFDDDEVIEELFDRLSSEIEPEADEN